MTDSITKTKKEIRDGEIILMIKRQTNYTEKEAKEKLMLWDNNYINVIKEYVNIIDVGSPIAVFTQTMFSIMLLCCLLRLLGLAVLLSVFVYLRMARSITIYIQMPKFLYVVSGCGAVMLSSPRQPRQPLKCGETCRRVKLGARVRAHP